MGDRHDETVTPRRLRYAGHDLLSACPLPILPASPASTTRPTLHVCAPLVVEHLRDIHAWRHEWQEKTGDISLRLALQQAGYLLRTLDLCDFLIDPLQGMVGIEHLPGLDSHTLEHLLVDQVLPRLLAARGALVVHASCIRIGPRGALFLGQSGWGKSTLAGLLQQRGHWPMSDDCAVLTLGDHAISALATYPSLRMYDDSIRHAFGGAANVSPVAGYTRKQRVRIDTGDASNQGDGWMQDEATPIDAIYLLNDPADAATDPVIAPLHPTQACMALIEHSFRLDLGARDQSAQQLTQAATVARMVPAFSLGYPRDYRQADAVVDTILEHFGSAHDAQPITR